MKIKQLLAELYECNNSINDLDALLDGATSAAERVGAQVVGTGNAVYTPVGLTAIVFLAESHIVLTTWPEMRLLLIDVLLCNPTMPPEVVLEELKAHFCPDGTVRTQIVERVVAEGPPAGEAG